MPDTDSAMLISTQHVSGICARQGDDNVTDSCLVSLQLTCQPPHAPHSLPASPTYHYSHRHGLGLSHNTSASCLRKTTSYGRPRSCRNSALFPDLRAKSRNSEAGHYLGNEDDMKRRLSIKSVHFVDSSDDIESGARLTYAGSDHVDYDTLSVDGNPLRRQRSKSNPQQATRKNSGSGNFHMLEAREEEEKARQQGEYSIRLKSDWLNSDPHSCKCYKIAQKSNTRLSNSAPDLTKLLPSLQLSKVG